MLNMEVLAFGFNGNTDDTDDRVIWVAAQSKEQIIAAIQGTQAQLGAELPGSFSADDGIDYVLPRENERLKQTLLQFEKM